MDENRIEQGLIKAGSEKVTEGDIEKVVGKSQEIQRRFSSGGPLHRFVDDGRLLLSAVRDYCSRRYRRLPVGALGAIVFSLLYVFNPLDLVPDVLPIVGQIDDAAVIAGCLLLVEHDLHTYAQWKRQQPSLPALPDKTPSANN